MSSNEYPDNVCVHGNGFVQVSLGGDPHETRIHIWHRDLPDCQHVNTAIHNHRFGFTSTVLRGAVIQEELVGTPVAHGTYNMWRAMGERLPTGNRPLVKLPGCWFVGRSRYQDVQSGHSYHMEPEDFHRTTMENATGRGVAVTLMTKTHVIPEDELQASVICLSHLEPDQEFDRHQVPFKELERIMVDALKTTPFEGLTPWRR